MYTQKIALSYWNQTPADKPLDLKYSPITSYRYK